MPSLNWNDFIAFLLVANLLKNVPLYNEVLVGGIAETQEPQIVSQISVNKLDMLCSCCGVAATTKLK